MAKVLNIEIGDKITKVCRTVRRGKGVRVFDTFMFPTPENSVSDGVISNSQTLSRELRKQLIMHSQQGVKNVIFTISASRIAAREVKLPKMNKKLINDAVKTNASDYFPIDLKDYHVAHYVLEQATVADPFNKILVMAVPMAILDGYFQLAEKAGLTIKALDTCGNSQYQALSHIGLKGVTMYVDVNGTSSITSFVSEERLLLQRSFSFGADELITHYMALTGKTDDQYLDVLQETDITSPNFAVTNILSASEVQEDLRHLVNGILRSIDYFNSSQQSGPVSRVVLAGLNRHVAGLREMLAEETGLETLYLDDIPEFSGIITGTSEAPTYLSCIGSVIAPLDLMPQKYLSFRRNAVDDKDASIKPGIIICAGIILVAAVLSFLSWFNYNNSLIDLKNTKTEISNLEYTQQTYDYYLSYKKSEGAVNAFTGEANAPNSHLNSFFEELEQKMPSSILIMSADCDNVGVSLNISVSNYEDAAAVITSLRSFQSLSSVSVSDVEKTKNEVGEERVTFTALCTYGTNPYQNNINPYTDLINSSPSPSGSDTAAGAVETPTATEPVAAPASPSPSPAQ